MHRRQCKERPSYLLLEKREWNRLKKQSDPPIGPSNEKTDYIKSIIEKSHAWTKTWPDNEHGQMIIYEQERKKQHEANLAAVEAAKKPNNKARKRHEEAIKVAKEKLFRESCYGQKLLFALRESKTLEERDVQIQFLKDIKEEKDKLQTSTAEASCTFALDIRATEEEKIRKCETLEAAQQNKELYEKHKAELAMAKEAQKQEDLENTRLMNKMLFLEVEAEEKVRLLENEALQQYLADRQKSKEEQAKLEAEYNTKIELCQKEKEELSCKIKRVLKDINKTADELPWAKKNYEDFIKRQEEERKRIQTLEDKISKASEFSAALKEQESKEKEQQDLVTRLSIAETNKAIAEYERFMRCPNANKCFCDRQSLFVKSDKGCMKNEMMKTEAISRPYFGPCNKLSSKLYKRMQEPSPWTGVKAKHEEFARYADNTLKECKYKKPAKKVIDEYMKNHRLDNIEIINYH